MDEWEINKPVGQCCGTGRQIRPGEEYFATLIETEEGLQRRDFCADYWQNEKPDVFCYWRTKLPASEQKKQIFVDDQMLMSFFERLEREKDEEKINFRFVLALILMRKKRLKYDSSRSEGDREIWRLRVAGENKTYIDVLNPRLNEDQIEQLSSQIGQILQVEL